MLRHIRAITLAAFWLAAAVLFDSCGLIPPRVAGNSSHGGSAVSAASSREAAPSLSDDTPLTCGQFVWLWMRDSNAAGAGESVGQALSAAKERGLIPADTDGGQALTRETLARLITARKYDLTQRDKPQLDESHYDWQLADLDTADPALKDYMLMAYAKGLLPAENGMIGPKSAVCPPFARDVLARMDGQGAIKAPPDQAAPYFEYKGLVEVRRLDPSVVLDLKYATTDNFTGVVHYPRVLCLLEAQTAKRLVKANRYFQAQGDTIKIWDAYRPVSVQWSLYHATPANLKQYAPAPSKNSQHSKGIAADITLVDKSGKELPMPTGFDNFTDKAHADYPDLPKEALANRAFLRKGMEQQGFTVYSLEWWHFYLPEKTGLSISDVSLDEFAQKERAFYDDYLKKHVGS